MKIKLLLLAILVSGNLSAQTIYNLSSHSPSSSSEKPRHLTFEWTYPVEMELNPGAGRYFQVIRTSDGDVALNLQSSTLLGVVHDGNDISLDLFVKFYDSNTSYHVTMDEGFFKQKDGTGLSEEISGSEWTFSTRVNDGVGPTITGFSPVNGSEMDRTTSTYTLTFSEPVFGIYSHISEVYLNGDANRELDIATTSLKSSTGTTTVDISDPMSKTYGQSYYITIDQLVEGGSSPLFYDADGNAVAGITNNSTWAFTTNSLPEITSTTPADDATTASSRGPITITLNNDLNIISHGTIQIRNSNSSTARSILTNSADFDLSGNVITLNYEDLTPGLSYYISIPYGIFEDNYGESFSFTDNATFNFTTDPNENLSPTDVDFAMGTVYENNLLSDYIGYFSTTDANPDDTHTYTLVSGAGDTDNSKFNLQDNQLHTNEYLDYETQHTFDIRIRTDDGNGATLEEEVTFSILDMEFEIASFDPVPESTDIDPDITSLSITFNKPPVVTGAGDLTLITGTNSFVKSFDVQTDDISISGNTLTVHNLPTLVENSSYTLKDNLLNGAIQDGSGNEMQQIGFYFEFTTGMRDAGDITDPEVSSTLPVDGATDVSVDLGSFVLNISEDVKKGDDPGVAGTNQFIEIHQGAKGSGNLIKRFDLNTDVSINGSQVTLSNIPTLSHNTSYWVRYYMSGGKAAITDLAGNPLPIYNASSAFAFTTAAETDDTPPAIEGLSPADDAIDISVNLGTMTMTMTEDVKVSDDPGVEGTNYYFELKRNSTVVKEFDVATADVEIAGNTITLKNLPLLSPSSSYSIRLWNYTKFPITDLAGNPLGSFNNTTTWNFTTDADIPQVTSKSPIHNATSVDVGSNLVLNFDRNVVEQGAGSGQRIQIWDIADNSVLEAFDINYEAVSDRVSGIGTGQITIDPITDLGYDTEYAIKITKAFRTESGALFSEFNNTTDWRFTTESEPDNEAPYITDLSPADDATDIAIDANIIITFNEEIRAVGSTNDILLMDYDAESLVEGFDPMDDGNGKITLSGNTVTLNPTNDLENGKHYYIVVDGYTLKDASAQHNLFAGINAGPGLKDEWDFSTEEEQDLTAPTTIGTYPTIGGTYADLMGACNISFDEDVQEGSGTISLHRANGLLVESVTTGVEDSRIVMAASNRPQITFDAGFEPSTEYYIVVSEGAFEDLAGNAFAGYAANEWYFTSNALPQITTYVPDIHDEGVAVDANLALTFDMVMYSYHNTNPSSNIYLYNYATDELIETISTEDVDVNGNVVTIDPVADFPYSTQIYVLFDAAGSFASDDNGELFVGLDDKDDWEFTTADAPDTTPPVLVSLSPTDDASDVSLDAVFIATFDEEIKMLENDQIVALYREGTIDRILNDDDSQLTIDGATLTIDFSEELLPATDYSIWITSSLSDLNDNYYTDHDQFTTWNFTTEDIMTVTAVSPGLNATDVALDADLVATFNHDIVVANPEGRVWVRDAKGYAMWGAINESNKFTVSGNTLTMHLAAGNPQPNSEYYFNVEENTISNAEGVFYTDGVIMVNGEVWRFTTGKANQVISIVTIADKFVDDADFDVVASTTSNLGLTYEVSGPAIISIDGTISLTGESGVVTVTVSQAGDDTYHAASAQISFNVNDPAKTDQTISFAAIADKTFGDTDFAISATANSGLDVAFSAVSGPVTLDGNMVTITGAGEVVIAADQAGDDTFNPAPQVTQSFSIAKADQTVAIEAIDDKLTTDDSFMVTATVDTGLPLTYAVSGPATVSTEGMITLHGTTGTVTVTVSQSGDDNYNSAEASETFEVTEPLIEVQEQTISFEEIAGKTFGDLDFALAATASSTLDVTFSVVSGPVTLSGNMVSITGAGEVVIAADQAGNESFNAAPQVTRSFTIAKADQTLTFEAMADKVFGDADFALSATASSTLDVTFSVVSGPATLIGNMVSILGAGEVVIAADQSGNDNYNAAAQATQSFSVAKADQTITIESIADKTIADAPFDVVASTTSELTLTYEVTGPATIDAATISLDGSAGTVTVIVSQAGDDNYNPAEETVTFEVESVMSVGLKEVQVSVYPNPASNWLQIEGLSAQEALVKIFDARGTQVMNEMMESRQQLAISHLEVGVYILSIISHDHTTTTKLLIRR